MPFLFSMQCLRVQCHQEKKCFKNEVLMMSYGPDRKLREEPTHHFSSQGLKPECVKMLFIFRRATWAWHHVNPECLQRFPWGQRKNRLYNQMCISCSSNLSLGTDKDVFRQISSHRFLRAFLELALGSMGSGLSSCPKCQKRKMENERLG